jgi:hypothetical protein
MKRLLLGFVLGVTLSVAFAATNECLQTTTCTLAGLTMTGGIVEKNYTVSTLPTCNSGAKYTRAAVSDAVACTFAATLTGGQSQACPVFCDGANWIGG